MSHSVSMPRLPCPSPAPRACSTHVHRVGDSIQWSHPLSFSSPSAFNLSSIRILSSESVFGIRWPKYWSFSISLSSEYSELISFRIDWFDLALHGALKSPPAPQFASITSLALTFLFHLSNRGLQILYESDIFLPFFYFSSKSTLLLYHFSPFLFV